MIGIVLWRDRVEKKAVFWCEDQGDLAYYAPDAAEQTGTDMFDVGDMVRFDVRVDKKLRKACNARLVQQHACGSVQESVRQNAQLAQADDVGAKSAQIIPFCDKRQPKNVVPKALEA